MKTLVLTGWGWKEYAVAAAVAFKALGGDEARLAAALKKNQRRH